MADDRESSGVGLPSNNDDYDLSKADEREVELLLQYGVAFRRFINEARDIERIYLEKTKRSSEDVRAAALAIRRSLESAASDVGGFIFGAIPVPLRLIFHGLNDVQKGLYGRVVTPSHHSFGQSYETFDRLMTIGSALAIWDQLQELGLKSNSARDRVVEALNEAKFKIPKTQPQRSDDSRQTTGEVTATAITQWRKRARRGDAHYADVYASARQNLKAMLGMLPVKEDKEFTADELVSYLKRYVFAHQLND